MLRLGSQELMVSLVVAVIADEVILGMDLLTQAIEHGDSICPVPGPGSRRRKAAGNC